MSTAPLGGIVPGAAGAPYAQRQGSEIERAAQDNAAQETKTQNETKAEKAAGIGSTEEDSEAEDRDADGRRLWEEQEATHAESDKGVDPATDHAAPQAKDVTGDAGNQLDLSG